MRRGAVGAVTIFAVIYTLLASAIYFSLGAVAGHAGPLTPLVYLLGGVLFVLAAMTYFEGASLHQERAGATVFARYAFNEVWSFVAGWALLLDYVILVAVTTFSATNYLAAFWSPVGSGAPELALCLALIAYVAVRNVIGFSGGRARRVTMLVLADFVLQGVIIVVGLALFFDVDRVLDPVSLGSEPTWGGLIFALGIVTVVFTGLESAAGLAGEIRVRRRPLRRLVYAAAGAVMVLYVGVALVAVMALPLERVTDGSGEWLEAPMLTVARVLDAELDPSGFRYVIAAAAAATLIAGANSAMLGLSRLAYSLSTHRQIPSAVGRLHPTRSTPFVVIGVAAALAGALVVPEDLEFLVGIFAFGALLGLTIAHLSIVVLRYREPDKPRPYKAPFSVRFLGGDLPLHAVAGALLSFSAWISVIVTHEGARYAGFGWLLGGLVLYGVYRGTQGKSLTQRVVVPEHALREREGAREAEYGRILVPILGTPLDDDIVQTAGRLAADESGDEADDREGAKIDAIWVFEIPMALPLDARLPEARLTEARAALRRAKAVGEEYEGVTVDTATVRGRRAGEKIVQEARRRGCEAIVMAAEEPSRIRGGAILGGRASMENFVGDATKYVLEKADCRVILTAPPAAEDAPPGDAVAAR